MNRFVILFLLAACAAEKPATEEKPARPAPAPPSAAEAKQRIQSSADFSEFEFTNAAYTLPLKRSAMNEPARAAATDLRKAGWIEFDGDDVLLSAKGITDKRFIIRPNGYVDIVPLARKEVIEVTAVRPTAEGVDADFTWKWIPNEIGKAFRSGLLYERYAAPQYQATATLIHDGTSWSILRIRGR